MTHDGAERRLQDLWKEIMSGPDRDFLDQKLIDRIKQVLRGSSKSFRYCLVTQCVGKWLWPDLDARCLQKARGSAPDTGGKAWDPRSFASAVIVPFELNHWYRVLGGSKDPYVAKPLRRPEISLDPSVVQSIRWKDDWRALFEVVSEIETRGDPELAERVVRQILMEIRRLIAEQKVDFQLPSPATFATHRLIRMLRRFLAQPSGGLRAQLAVYAALKAPAYFADVTTHSVTTADEMAGRYGDVQCYDETGQLVLVASVKDVRIRPDDIQHDLGKLEQTKASLAVFAFRGVENKESVGKLQARAAETGRDVLVFDGAETYEALSVMLGLATERERRNFVLEMNEVLNLYGARQDKEDWKQLLSLLRIA